MISHSFLAGWAVFGGILEVFFIWGYSYRNKLHRRLEEIKDPKDEDESLELLQLQEKLSRMGFNIWFLRSAIVIDALYLLGLVALAIWE